MVMEQLIESMPREAQLRVRERKPKTTKEAGEMADDYYLGRKEMTGEDKRRCYKCDWTGHLASECKVVRVSIGKNTARNSRSVQDVRHENNIVTAPRNQTWSTRQESSTRTAPQSQTWKQDELRCLNVTVWDTLL